MGLGRVACLSVPGLPLAALVRAEPDLADQAVAVSESPGPRACVLASSREARRAGVVRGMTAVQARSLLPELRLRPLSPALVRSAQAALLDVARSFSPRVSLAPSGEVYLDVDGIGQRFESERRLGVALLGAAHRVGLEIRVGVAGGVLVARLAALTLEGGLAHGADPQGEPLQVIAPDEERAFLAPLPVSLLESSARVRVALERFGIERLGQLAALPSQGLGRRLGPECLRLWRLARGEERRGLVADPLDERFVEESDPGWPMDRIEPLLHELSGLLQRLSDRLECRGLRARRVDLTLELEPDGLDERSFELASPSRVVSTWVEVIRLALEAQPPRAPVAGLRVELQVVAARQGQMDFFERGGADRPAVLDDALARLAALAGEGRVGSPRLCDSHHPDDFAVVPLGDRGPDPWRPPASAAPLHAVRPPLPVQVRLGQGRPIHVTGAQLAERVRRAGGPWRLEGVWWRERALARDYYDVELSDGVVYRLFQEHGSGEWYLDGICG